jgi:PAS domain S-box-containing protein
MNDSTRFPSDQLAEQFRAAAELSGDIVFILDCGSGLPLYIGDGIGALLGYGAADVRRQLADPDPASPLAPLCAGLPERLRRFAEGDRSRLKLVRQFRHPRKDGSLVQVEAITSLLTDAEGKAATLVGVLRDISAQYDQEAERRRFASMLNHEFRTPLSTIDGAIQRLEAKSAHADEATRRRYRNIGEAVDRLIGMLDEYLSPDRLEAIGKARQADGICPALLLEEGALRVRAAGREATVEASGLPARLRCAPDGLRLALRALVENAIQYSPPDTAIALVGRQAEDGIELLVRDHGGGVPDGESEKIFDKFYRGSNAGASPGSGLGLYMARSVIDVHGGSVVLGQSGGCGAEFRIWLPSQDRAGKRVASDGIPIDNSAEHY